MQISHSRSAMRAACLILALLTISCDLKIYFREESPTTTTTTTTVAESSTRFTPAFTFGGDASVGARVATSTTLSSADYNFALGCPALAGFAENQFSLNEGSSFTIDYLGQTVTFTVHFFTDGDPSRLAEGVRYTGTGCDGSVVLLVEYNPVSRAFHYEQSLFIDDAIGRISGQAGMKSVIYYTMNGTAGSDGSILANPKGAAYNVVPNYGQMMFCYKKMEYYSGQWQEGSADSGTGIVLRDVSATMLNQMPATAGIYSKPATSISVTDLASVAGYLKAVLDTFSPTVLNQYQLMYKVEGQQTFASMMDYLNGYRWQDSITAPTSASAAKSRLPSAIWKTRSTF